VGVQSAASLHRDAVVYDSGGPLVQRHAGKEPREALNEHCVGFGLRWSEQARLHWLDVDLLTGFLTVRLAKNGQAPPGAAQQRG
jgi:hypothetical protein